LFASSNHTCHWWSPYLCSWNQKSSYKPFVGKKHHLMRSTSARTLCFKHWLYRK
jgi:hypothetical protein